MKELKLLIVEDDQEAINAYKREIKAFNKERELSFGNDLNIIETSIKEKEKALNILRNSNEIFDAAIVDLDLLGTGGEDSSGNEVAREIKKTLRFPVFIITGTPQNIDKDLQEESIFFRIKTRGEQEDESYLDQFAKIYNTGITNILNRKGTIEKYLTSIFWDNLSSSIEMWINDTSRNAEQKEKSLLRYTLLHIQEHLELTEENSFENYHPAEIYITPPIKPHIFTGDIITENATNTDFIILSPSCDLAQNKAKDILLVQIEKNADGIISEKRNLIIQNKAKADIIEEAKIILHKLIHNSFSNKYHFLPKFEPIEGGLINFQKVKSLRKNEIETNYVRVASLNSQFTKDVVARFSYYYSRQGSPDFNSEEIYNLILED